MPSSNESPCLRARADVIRAYCSTSCGVPAGGRRASRSSSGSCAAQAPYACPPRARRRRSCAGSPAKARHLIERTADIDRLKRLSTRVSTASVLIVVPYLRSVSMSFSVSLPRAMINARAAASTAPGRYSLGGRPW